MIRNDIFVKDLTCTYADNVILNAISFAVPRGSTCVIIGPSGCGKTTLLHTLAGFVKPISGELRVGDKPVIGFPKNTGIVLQDYALLPWSTVYENVALGLKMRHQTSSAIQQQTEKILNELDIAAIADHYPAQISGGQKQRVAIARSLNLNPEILLLDEATSAVDAITKEQLQALLLSIHQSKKTTLVQVTHSIEEAVFLGEKIIIMKQGEIHKTLQNPVFGVKDSRKNPAFYKMCLTVRESLESGNKNEI